MNEPLSHQVTLDTGLAAHVLEWNAGDRSREHTVFLIHGFLDFAWSWEGVVREGLADRYHVVAYDVRGHGDSDPVGAGGYYHFMDFVADFASLVDQLARERVAVVGHSMGGGIASYYAGAFPARVHQLALLEGTGPPEDEARVPERLASWIADTRKRRGTLPAACDDLESAAERLVRHDPLLDPELALALARHGTEQGSDGRFRFKHDPLHLTWGPYPFRLDVAESFWRAIQCPILLVEGAESPMKHAGEDAARRRAAFADARNEVIEGAGHMMQRHRPRELARLLCDFIG